MANGQVTFDEQFDKNFIAGLEKIQIESNKAFESFKKMTIEIEKVSKEVMKLAGTNKELVTQQQQVIKNEIQSEKLKNNLLLQEQKINNELNKGIIIQNKRLQTDLQVEAQLNRSIATEKKLIETNSKVKESIDKTSVAYQQQLLTQQKAIQQSKALAAVMNAEANTAEKSRAIINYLTIEKDKLGRMDETNAKRINAFNRAIENQRVKLSTTNSSIQQQAANVGNYANKWNALGNSINQLGREAPAFANSMNTGFMAISNNLPALFDALSGIREQNKALAAEGKPTTSVLKQLGGALFSWQSLLSVGVTLLTVYGGKMVEIFSGENSVTAKAKKNIDEANKSLNDLIDNLDSYQNKNKGVDANAIFKWQDIDYEDAKKGLEDAKKAQKILLGALIWDNETKSYIETNVDEQQSYITNILGSNLEKKYNDLTNQVLYFESQISKLKDEYDKKEKEKEDKKTQDAIKKHIEFLENQKAFEVSLITLRKNSLLETFNAEKKWDEKILEYKRYKNQITETEYKTHLQNMKIAEREFIGLDELDLQKQTGRNFNGKGGAVNFNQKESFLKTTDPKKDKPQISAQAQSILPTVSLIDQLKLNKDIIKSTYSQIYDITKEHFDKMAEISKKKNDDAKEEVKTKREQLRDVKDAIRNGEAGNLQLAEKALNDAIKVQAKTEREQKKALRNQFLIQSAEQASNLITGTSKILASTSLQPWLSAALIGSMWTLFAATKVKAAKETKLFANGGTWIEGGKTHAQGGNQYGDKEFEAGERVGIFSRKATNKYGKGLEYIINAANKGTLKLDGNKGKGAIVVNMSTTKLENGMNKLVSLNEEKIYFENGKKVVKRGNVTKIYV